MHMETHNSPVGANCLQVVFHDCKAFLVCRGYLVPEVFFIFENLAIAVDKAREILAPPSFSIQKQYSIHAIESCAMYT